VTACMHSYTHAGAYAFLSNSFEMLKPVTRLPDAVALPNRKAPHISANTPTREVHCSIQKSCGYDPQHACAATASTRMCRHCLTTRWAAVPASAVLSLCVVLACVDGSAVFPACASWSSSCFTTAHYSCAFCCASLCSLHTLPHDGR
jgi:hypothetical protein